MTIKALYHNFLLRNEADRVLTLSQLRNLLYPILTAGLAISTTALVLSIVSSIYYADHPFSRLTPQLLISLVITLIFWALLASSQRYPTFTALIFICSILLASFNSLAQYGFVTPQPLLGIAVCVLAAGVLISKYAATVFFLLSITCITTISTKQISNPTSIPVVWSNTAVTWGDTILILVTLGCIYWLTGIYSKENKKSLKRAVNLESLTKTEISTLHESMFRGHNTKDVETLMTLKEKVGGTFHDVINPLSGISLALETLMNTENLSRDEVEEMMSSSAQNIQIASTLIHNLREELNNTPTLKEWFSPVKVLGEIKVGLTYPLRKEGIALTITGDENILLYGDRLSFNRICSNLIINSREAYLRKESLKEKLISIKLTNYEKHILITFTDSAGGIPRSAMPHIFTLNFSTKQKPGSGQGLSFVNRKLREDFAASIDLTSKKDSTKFTIQIEKAGDNVVSVK